MSIPNLFYWILWWVLNILNLPMSLLIFVLKTWQEFENWRGKDLWVSFPKRILSSIVSPEGIPHFRCVQISEIVLFVKSYMIPTIRRSCVVQSTDWNNRAGCEHGQTRKLSIIWLGQRIWRMECQVSYQGLCEKGCMINMRIKEWPFHLYFTFSKSVEKLTDQFSLTNQFSWSWTTLKISNWQTAFCFIT